MKRKDEEIRVTATEARSGSTPHIVRYVLLTSLVLAVVALSVIWMTGANNNTPQESDAVSNHMGNNSTYIVPDD